MKSKMFLAFFLVVGFGLCAQEKQQLTDVSSLIQVIPVSDMTVKKDNVPTFPNLKNQVSNKVSRIFYYDNLSLIYLNISTTMVGLTYAYFDIAFLQNAFELPAAPGYDYFKSLFGAPLSEKTEDKFLISMYSRPYRNKTCVVRLYFSSSDKLLKMVRLDF